MDKYSYITILTNMDFYPGLCALFYSLKKVDSKFPLTVVIPETASEELQNHIHKLGLPILKAPELQLPEELQKANPYGRWNETFFKLQIFNLTQFEKVVFLDLDMIIVQNIDELFDKPHMSAVPAGRCAHNWWTSFNSGLMVIEPNNAVYQEIISCIPVACKVRLQKNQGFGDQDVLNFYYANWWNNQNVVLSEIYNAVTFAFEEVCRTFGYDNLKVIHYAEPPKIWQRSEWKVHVHIFKCVLTGQWNRARMCSKYLRYLRQSRV